MKTILHAKNGVEIVEVCEPELLITGEQGALDLMFSLPSRRVVLRKENLAEDFFVLSSGLAGAILQKFVNYRVKLGIVGDFAHYSSKNLQDFIRESNRSDTVVFVPTVQEAVDRLSKS